MPPKAMKEAGEIGHKAPAKLRAEGHNEGSAGMVDDVIRDVHARKHRQRVHNTDRACVGENTKSS